MTTNAILGFTHLAENQSGKHVVVNANDDAMVTAANGAADIAITGHTTLTAAQLAVAHFFDLTGAPGAPFNLRLPAVARSFRLRNSTDGAATIMVDPGEDGADGTTVVLAVGETASLQSDGTDVLAFGGGAAVDPDTLYADVADTLTKGFDAAEFDAGTKTTGSYTPAPADGNFQKAVNGGAHTLAPPGSTCSIIVQYTNNASAGAITTSGFTKVTGDAISTTDGDDFFFFITRNNGFSHLHVQALQ